MRDASILLAGVLALAACAHAGERGAEDVWRIHAGSTQALQESLLSLSETRLRSSGWFIDRRRAWLSLSDPLPPATDFEARPMWSAGADAPSLPLLFEIRPGSHGGNGSFRPQGRSIQAALAVRLLRDVAIAERRLRKGSLVTCADIGVQRRDVRNTPKSLLPLPCDLAPASVALRDLAAGDAIRSGDVGPAPAVVAGAPVSVNVMASGIVVTTRAIALADAEVGDRIDVRLQRPTRILRTRVVGPGHVQLLEGAP